MPYHAMQRILLLLLQLELELELVRCIAKRRESEGSENEIEVLGEGEGREKGKRVEEDLKSVGDSFSWIMRFKEMAWMCCFFCDGIFKEADLAWLP